MQHLRIMESLGGDTRWSDRFLARHAAVIYFLVLTLVSRPVDGYALWYFHPLIPIHLCGLFTDAVIL